MKRYLFLLAFFFFLFGSAMELFFLAKYPFWWFRALMLLVQLINAGAYLELFFKHGQKATN